MSFMRPLFPSLRSRLLLLVVLAMVPAFALAVYSHLDRRAEAGERVRENALSVARGVAQGQQELIARTESTLMALQRVLALAGGGDIAGVDPTACSSLLKTFLHDGTYSNLGVATLNGDVICSAVPTTEPVNVADRGYFQAAIRDRGLAVGDFVIGRITGRAAFPVGYPILGPNGEPVGVVFAAIDIEAMARGAAATQLPADSSTTLTDRQGTVLFRSSDGASWIGKSGRTLPGLRETAAPAFAGTVEAAGLDGVERLYAFVPLRASEEAVNSVVHVGIPSSLAFADANHTLLISLMGLSVATLVSLILAWIGGGIALSRPVNALDHATRRIADGDLSVRTGPPYSSSELGQLGRSIDAMAEALSHRQMDVERLTTDLERRVAQRTAELQAANAELEAFSYSVSHDLRAPLRAIDGFSQTLLRDYRDRLDERGRERLDRVRAATQRLATLIDDLLLLSRTTRAEMRRERVDLSIVARQIAVDLHESEPARAVTFEVEGGLEVVGDPGLLRAVLQNLLSNAWKFTLGHASAHIEFGMTDTAEGPAFFVRDDGAGFDMAYAGKLFSPFQRLHADTQFEGNGIGLATVQRIIRRHGGRVWAEGAVDHGATIYFTIPDESASTATTARKAA